MRGLKASNTKSKSKSTKHNIYNGFGRNLYCIES